MQLQIKPVVKVLGNDIVHGQLHSKAVSVSQRQNPASVVGDAVVEDAGEFVLGLVAGLLEPVEVPVRRVLAEDQDGEGGERLKQSRDEERDPPSGEFDGSEVTYEGEHERHDHLGRATAEVAPATGDAVGGADNGGGEHGAHPELSGDESGEGEAGEEPDEEERDGAVGHGGEVDGGGGDEDEGGGGEARAKEVAGGAHGETGEDGAGDGGDAGIADVGGGEVEVVANDGEERRSSEGRDEAGEEGDPRQVEGSHVGLGYRE